MARKTTSTSKKDAASAKVDASPDAEDQVTESNDDVTPEDAKIVEATAEEVETPDENIPDMIESDDEGEADQNDTSEPEQPEPQDENADQTDDVPVQMPAPVVTQTVVERKGGFVPMLLGGLIAGGIGFGAAYYVLPQSGGQGADAFQQDVTAKLDQNTKDISGLTQSIAELPEASGLTSLVAESSDLRAVADSLATRLDDVEARFAALDDRLTTVEKRPISEGASDAAVAAYERELKALQDTMAAQRAELEAMASEAQNMETNAEETAKATMLRSALTRIQTAMDTGTGFASALGELHGAGLEIPAALSDVAEDGVLSLAQLQSSFPDAARAALAVSRREAADSGEQSGFAAFVKNQLGTRSLEPRTGDDPDAVLSRAEAAAREGRLADTLAELEALPEAGRAALSDWTAQVTRRQGAVAAAEALGQKLN